MAVARGAGAMTALLVVWTWHPASTMTAVPQRSILAATLEAASVVPAAGQRSDPLSLVGSGCKSDQLQNLTLVDLLRLNLQDPELERSDSATRSERAEDDEKTTVVTTTTMTKPQSGAEATGVTKNDEGDLEALIGGLVSNVGAVVFMVFVMLAARRWYRPLYENNAIEGWGPQVPTPGMLGWAKASLSVTIEQAADHSGLDSAMYLEFQRLCRNVTATYGLPLLLVVGPINFAFGGGAAGDDTLSYFCMNNVRQGSPLFWLHSLCVWGVCIAVQQHVFRAQKKFLGLRYKWLRELPEPRATSILVECVPDEYRTDERLFNFFEDMFGEGRVKSAYLAKRAPELQAAWEGHEDAKQGIAKATYAWDKVQRNPKRRPLDPLTGEDLLEYYTKELHDSAVAIKEERAKARQALSTPCGVNGSNGFVTFYSTADAELATNLHYSSDAMEWVVSTPPPPQSLLWHDLEQDDEERNEYTFLGYALTACLYCLYLPIVLWITNIAMTIRMPGALQPLWESLAPTVGLQFMVCFLPTFLSWIFTACFTLKDDGWAQQILQNWYYIFQLVFIVLITAIGPSLFEFMYTLVYKPIAVLPILAQSMPFSTHFYMNYVILSWTCIAMELTRYMQIGKFFALRKLYEDEEARKLSEPEDQDYYGMGARYARTTIFANISIIYSTISPPVALFCWVTFMWGRAVYGYLVLFAETKKADLGGEFYVVAVNQLFIGNIIYCLTMTGILYENASTGLPATISLLSIGFVLFSMYRFDTEFNWETLPYEEHKADEKGERTPHGEYVQPEWRAVSAPRRRASVEF